MGLPPVRWMVFGHGKIPIENLDDWGVPGGPRDDETETIEDHTGKI